MGTLAKKIIAENGPVRKAPKTCFAQYLEKKINFGTKIFLKNLKKFIFR
jgi:hypothetical protein